jgi:prevent-host-death family protein
LTVCSAGVSRQWGVQTSHRDQAQFAGEFDVHLSVAVLYTSVMEVAVTELRAHLSDWIAQAKGGVEVVVTERGLPVARLSGIGTTTTLDRLTELGHIARPARLGPRPVAAGRSRPRAVGSVAEIVSEQRR